MTHLDHYKENVLVLQSYRL